MGVTGGWVVEVVVLGTAGAWWRCAGAVWAAGDPGTPQPAATSAADQDDEEQDGRPRRHPAQRCTCRAPSNSHPAPLSRNYQECQSFRTVTGRFTVASVGLRTGSFCTKRSPFSHVRDAENADRRRTGTRGDGPAPPPGRSTSAGGPRTRRAGGRRSGDWHRWSGSSTGPKRTTETWGRGADGEERIGRWLDDAVGRHGVVLHDRAVHGRRTNLDHIVVVPSGIWVIDSKHYRGTARAAGHGRVVRPASPPLRGRSRPDRAGDGGEPPAGTGGRGAGRRPARPGRAVLHRRRARPVHSTLHGAGGARHLAEGARRTLAAPGPLGLAERRALADRLARAFPPYPS